MKSFSKIFLLNLFFLPIGFQTQAAQFIPAAVVQWANTAKIEDLVVRFEYNPSSEAENQIFTEAFGSPCYSFKYNIKNDGCYENGDQICVRAYAYIQTDNELFKKTLVGLALIRKPNPTKKMLYIDYLCVGKKWRNRNIGKSIIEELENHYKPDSIELSSLSTAINFYKKIGFEPETEWSNHMIKRCI